GSCSDFYQFGWGGWLGKTEIPADKPTWSRSFTSIADRNEQSLRNILEHDLANLPKDADPGMRKVSAYYGACMAEDAIEADKLKPIEPLFLAVKKVKDKKSLADTVLALHRYRIWVLFDTSDTQDS